jgi:hypothetical protein
MRRLLPALLATALPLAALAQGMGQGLEADPPGSSPAQQRLQELRQGRDMGGDASMAPQRPAAPQASRGSGPDDPVALLKMAEEAAGRGQWGRTNEYLERASTRLLTRSSMPAEAGTPETGGAIGSIAKAREAVRRRDRGEAQRQIEMAARRRWTPPRPPAVAGALVRRPSPARRSPRLPIRCAERLRSPEGAGGAAAGHPEA